MEVKKRRIVVKSSEEPAVFEKSLAFDEIYEKYKDVLDKVTAEWAKAIDRQVITGMKRAAGTKLTFAKEDVIAEIKRAIDFLETPDYFLFANTAHSDELGDSIKNIKGVKIKVIYSPLVKKTDYILIKRSAVSCIPPDMPQIALSTGEDSWKLKFNRKEIEYFKVD